MKVSLIEFPYADSTWDACKGNRLHKAQGVALLLEDGNKKVVVTERPAGVQAFELLDKDDAGVFRYNPMDSAAILPETEYSVIGEFKSFPEKPAQILMDSVEYSKQLHSARSLALQTVNSSRQIFLKTESFIVR